MTPLAQRVATACALASLWWNVALAQSDSQELAKKLSNPIASLISVPFQLNYDEGFGPDDGHRYLLNIQPVIPISISDDWNMIVRVILPVISQNDVFGDSGSDDGLGDTVASLFFSPKQAGPSGLIWGVGPVFSLPTATEDTLGSEKWGIGPTAVALRQGGPWTYGVLANHLWSVAGDDDRADFSSTFLQPFVSYTTATAWTTALNTEASYDWKAEEWSVPINLSVSKLLTAGNQPISVGGGLRWWADSPPGGPEGLGLRAFVTLLFPK
ncbi:transporter [Sulfitobacter sp. LCG007]